MEIREKESVSQIFRLPSLDKQDTWYPTLRKTVWVLSQLHDYVKVDHSLVLLEISLTENMYTAGNIRGHRAGGRQPVPAIARCRWRHVEEAESANEPFRRPALPCTTSTYPQGDYPKSRSGPEGR